MTKQGLTYIAMILDRSGSMSDIKTDMEGALNTFLTDQKTIPGDCQVSLFQFDDEYEAVFTHQDIEFVPKVEIVPRNMTALYDAVGKTVNWLGEHFNKMKEEDRPEKVIVVIITDGLENASKEFTQDKVREMIKHQEEVYGWAFTYIGANQDAYAVGGSVGVAASSSLNYGANFRGTQVVGQTLSSAVTRTRMKGGPASASYSYTDEEQDAADLTVE